MKLSALDLLDRAADLSVIKPDGLTGFNMVKDLGSRATDPCRRQHTPTAIDRGGPPRLQGRLQHEQIAWLEGNCDFQISQLTDLCFAPLACIPLATATQRRS